MNKTLFFTLVIGLFLLWALAIGSVVLFILFGFGHSFLWHHANDYGIDLTNIY